MTALTVHYNACMAEGKRGSRELGGWGAGGVRRVQGVGLYPFTTPTHLTDDAAPALVEGLCREEGCNNNKG